MALGRGAGAGYRRLSPLGCLAGMVTLLAAAVAATPAAAKDLSIDVSEPVVQITAGFAGTEVLLFGAKQGPGDVIVVLRGPNRDQVVRRKVRKVGVWVNADRVTFKQVPTFYWMASNRPIDEFLGDKARNLYQIGLNHLTLQPVGEVPPGVNINDFRQGLKRTMVAKGLFKAEPELLTFVGDHLFRTRVRFPANVPTGTFSVDVYLVRDGKVVDYQTSLLNVRKFGLEAGIYDFAQRHALVYGILAIVIAVVAGWTANAIFRRA